MHYLIHICLIRTILFKKGYGFLSFHTLQRDRICLRRLPSLMICGQAIRMHMLKQLYTQILSEVVVKSNFQLTLIY